MKTETLKSTPRSCSLWLEIYPAISHAFIYHGGQISLYTQCNKVNALIEDQQQEWIAASQEMRVATVLAWATLTTSTWTRDSDRKQGVPSQPCGDIYTNAKWQSRSKWTVQWVSQVCLWGRSWTRAPVFLRGTHEGGPGWGHWMQYRSADALTALILPDVQFCVTYLK